MTSTDESSSSQSPQNNRRSYWQVVNGPGADRVFVGKIVIAALFILPIVAGFSCQMLWQIMEEISHLHFDDASIASHLVGELRSVGFLFLSVIILLCLLGFYFVFFLSVRIYGPQVALLRFIEQIKSGNYAPYRRLRKDDQLKEIWQGLQDLAAELRRKKS